MSSYAPGPTASAPNKEVQDLLSEISNLRSKLLKVQSALATYKRGERKSIEQCLDLVGSGEGRLNLEQVLAKVSFPHYEAVREEPGVLIRIDADGTRSRGEFVGRNLRVLASA